MARGVPAGSGPITAQLAEVPRTAAITGGYVALARAVNGLIAEGKVPAEALGEPIAAISVGLVDIDVYP